ncbi:MAG: transcriptional repressor LexA [Elusimicrobiota bacterium]
MQSNILTDRQKEILDFVIHAIEVQGFPPTIPEIQKEFSFKSPTAANDHLEALAKKGYITRHPHKSRGIEVAVYKNGKQNNSSNACEIPIVGRVAAGTPILASENLEGTLFVDKSFIKQVNGVFALRVNGDSMINAGILNGDFVIIQQQAQVNQGEIGVVLIDNEATVKRIYKEKDRIRLQPENDTMKPTIIDPKEKEVSIIGKVKGVIRKM